MVTSGVVMNWMIWGVLASVGSYFFLVTAGRKR